MLDQKSIFDGNFDNGCVEDAVPPSLLQFVGMVEHGAESKFQLIFNASKAVMAIAKLLQYNCYARYKEGAATNRHSKDRKIPFHIYLGMFVHAKTWKRTLVEMLHEYGLAISYDRVLEISAQLGEQQ